MSTKKGAVKFGTPPPRKESPYDWDSIAKQLRKKPGKPDDEAGWALVFEADRTSLVTAIRQSAITALRPDRGFEVRTANNVRSYPRTCDLWMRYVPDYDTTKEDN